MNIIFASGSLLDVDPGLFVWILITFVCFAYLFGKFAWKPILAALNNREKSIKESLEAAQVALKKAEEISRDNDAKLREAEVIAQKIRKEAAEQAEAIRADRIEKAKEEAAKLLEQARVTIQTEKKKAMEDLRNEVADLALKSARLVIDAELDSDKNSKLVDNYIKDLSKN